MKYLLITALFLTPFISYAGGHQSENKSISNSCNSGDTGGDTPAPVVAPPVAVPVVVPVTPPNSPQQNTLIPQASSNGGGMIYCSGPLSPGWHVDIPGGGCAPVNGPVTVKLSAIPYTGLTFWEWLKQLI